MPLTEDITSNYRSSTDSSAAEASRFTGRVRSVRGSVIDVVFEHDQPELQTRLVIESDPPVIAEVSAHVDDRTVRALALNSTQGLSRGTEVVNSGSPLTVPVGDALLGRVVNVFGEPIDQRGAVDRETMRSIFQPKVSLSEQETG